jgi:branched-chain amino acid transport system substrate-binding protein
MRTKFGLLVATAVAAATVCVSALAGSQATPGVTSHLITIGGTFPLTGPAGFYSPIPVGMKVYFTHINATRDKKTHKRGVNGRQIAWKYYDDSYNPPTTIQMTRQLVEQNKVFALFGGLGTEPQQAVEDYLNQQKVPQLFVSTGATEFGTGYKKDPYTIGWQPDYVAEGTIYGKYAAANWPTKKIGVMYQNDSYGQDYLKGLKAGLGSKASNIVTEQPFAATDTNLGQQVGAIEASGAQVIAIFALPGGTITTYGTMKALNYKPEEVILNSVSATDAIMKLALSKGLASTLDGSISTAYLMDPQNPKYAKTPGMKLYKAQMAKWAPGADANNALYLYGFAKAWDVAKLLQKTGPNPTRAKLLYQVRHINWVNPLFIPGVKEHTSPTDPFPIKQQKLIRFNASTGLWTEFGSLINGRTGH